MWSRGTRRSYELRLVGISLFFLLFEGVGPIFLYEKIASFLQNGMNFNKVKVFTE
ncbi:hypothetical protein [Persicirhabdus sediminis]|uniref:Uncharacterized protein n=1 Tax=Persicirhabdus sediminis TaxID=454144 RepID=A0A8J7MCZ8_9BACT|nr:hypothetical protein [Persicirhabdus sediminis]MBK1790258.1 hypothetical protein [Persicirhabdus sediminis]